MRRLGRSRPRDGAHSCLVAVAVGVFCCSASVADAQRPGLLASADLPDAPTQASPNQTTQLPAANSPTGAIAGTVLDVNGNAVPGASVELLDQTSGQRQTTTADGEGAFHFDGLAAGHFQLTISAPGLATFVSNAIPLRAGEHREQPRISLPVATAHVDVGVVVSEQELATEQVHAEEKQRLLGVLPNFYSSYIWDAAPLSSRQKFALAVRATVDPAVFAGAAIAAGAGQWFNTYGQYGQGAAGYFKRFGAAYADGATGTMIGKALLPSLLHQDPRYFYRGSGTVRQRALYAISTAVICKSDKGKWQPNYSNVLGNLAAGGISNLYYPSHDRGISLTFTNWAIGTAGDAANGLVREFFFRKLTADVPDYAKGKP